MLSVYMTGLRYIFIFYAACVGSAFVMCLGIGNTSLKAKRAQGKSPAQETSQVLSESDASVREEEKRQGTKAEV